MVRKNHKCGLQQQAAGNMGIEVTHCHRQIITYDGGGEQRAQVVMVAAWQGNVFSLLLLFWFCFVFRRKRRRLRNPKI
jgi:hypothetical protein